MREIKAQQITDVVKNLCIKANCYLPADVKKRIEDLRAAEPWPQAQEVLDRIIENYNIAEEGCRPICQDTGLACVFVKVGQDVHIDGNLNDYDYSNDIVENYAKIIKEYQNEQIRAYQFNCGIIYTTDNGETFAGVPKHEYKIEGEKNNTFAMILDAIS